MLFLRPIATDEVGAWRTDAAGTDLHTAIDEAARSDADFIRSGDSPSSDICRVRLAIEGDSTIDPDAGPVVVLYPLGKSDNAETINQTVRLLQGLNVIGAWLHSNVSTTIEGRQRTLTTEQAALVDWETQDNFYLEFDASSISLDGVVFTGTEVLEDAPIGTVVGHAFMQGGTEPATFEFDASTIVEFVGNEIRTTAALTGLAGAAPQDGTVIDAHGLFTTFTYPLEIVEVVTEPPVDPPDDPPDGGGENEFPPVVGDTADGPKITGKNGGSASLFQPMPLPIRGSTIIGAWTADLSGMSQDGRYAHIGVAFKNVSDFHLVGQRGDGSNPVTMLAARSYGDFSQPNAFTVETDGAITHGTKDAAQFAIEFLLDGNSYTYRSRAGETVADEFTSVLPPPLSGYGAAIQFGLGGFFTNNDKGVYQVTITQWRVTGIGTADIGHITADEDRVTCDMSA